MNALALTAALKQESLRLGFDLAGATPAVAPADFDRFHDWLAAGYAGEMRYLTNRLDAYRHPAQLIEGTRSILMLGMNYRTVEPAQIGPYQAKVSRHAWGSDYHEIVRHRLDELIQFHRRLAPTAGVRGVVDTAPLRERYFGRRAGLGWIGKNTMLINRRLGSWFFLAALLTTEELEYDEPCDSGHCEETGTGSEPPNAIKGKAVHGEVPVPVSSRGCGSCRACLDACPTGALVAPYRLDARKCISYLTIELRGAMPPGLREACGNRLFGCDACQEACPWNRRTPATAEPSFLPGVGMNPVDLAELSALDEAAFRRRFRHTPLWRAKREGILRNASVVSENSLANPK